MISFEYNCEVSFRPSLKHKLWLQQVIRKENKIPGDISYIFCDDAYMLEQNKAFLNHDTYTDIITFDECVGDVISGSILISTDRVAENASKFEKAFENELLIVDVNAFGGLDAVFMVQGGGCTQQRGLVCLEHRG